MKIERPKSLTELAVDELRARIVDGRLQLGEGLSENALATELGLSKTPVREALLQLKLERLVEVQPQRGTYVFRLAAEQVVLISEMREILEVAAAPLALARNRGELTARMREILDAMETAVRRGENVAYRTLDGQYHQAFVDLCGNAFLGDAYGHIAFRIQALRSRLSTDPRLNERSLRDHRAMLALVEGGKVAALQRLLRRHMAQTRDSYLAVIERGERPAPEDAP